MAKTKTVTLSKCGRSLNPFDGELRGLRVAISVGKNKLGRRGVIVDHTCRDTDQALCVERITVRFSDGSKVSMSPREWHGAAMGRGTNTYLVAIFDE